MRIKATHTGTTVELFAAEKRQLLQGLGVCSLLSVHADTEEMRELASNTCIALRELAKRYAQPELKVSENV